jgi:hypothetical protein
MLKNRSNRQRFWIVIVLIACSIWICYNLTFSKTIQLWKESRRLKEQKEFIKDIPEQLPLLTAKVERLENVLGNSGGVDFSTLILEQINLLCQQYSVNLKEIPEKHQFYGDNLIIETIDVNLQGGFINQLSIVSKLENINSNARLRSLKFQSVFNQTTGEHKLQSTLYLQSIHLITDKSNSLGYEKPDN